MTIELFGFKDFKEQDKYYYIAKDVAEHIEIAIDEIEDLDGVFDILETFISFKGRYVLLSTRFRNLRNDTVYSWDFRLKYSETVFIDFVPKFIYWWNRVFQKHIDDWEHNVCFEIWNE